MSSAAALRLEIEHALERRFPAALSPAPRALYEVAETGIQAVDELMNGGLPVGTISEVTGAVSSGRTSLALQFVARRTVEQRPCAWVDAQDAFDPESAAANGVRLRWLLWVRCAISHPFRDEAAKRMGQREQYRGAREQGSEGTQYSWRPHPWWKRLDQAIRATDLLLQAGGFSSIVLDLADTAPEQANRIPLATWFRLRQAAERTQCSLLVLGRRAYAQSAAAVVLECTAQAAEQRGGTVLRGLTYAVRCGRERQAPLEITTRKPVASTWQANAAWGEGARA